MGGKKGKDKSKKKKKDKDDDDDDDEDRPWYTRTWPGSLFALIGYICVFWSVLRCDFLMVYPNGPPKPEGGDRYLMVGCFCPMKPKPEENEKLEEAAAAMGADEVLYVATDVPGYLAKGPPLSDLPTTDNIAKPGSNIYVTMAWGGAVGSLFCGMISLIMSSLMAVGYASAAAGSCAMLVFMIHKSIPCAESISDRGTCQFGFGAYVLMAGVVLWTVSMFFTSFAFDWQQKSGGGGDSEDDSDSDEESKPSKKKKDSKKISKKESKKDSKKKSSDDLGKKKSKKK